MIFTMKRSRRILRGFTLIELLTVIAIIAILAAILFPVFGAVRENARRAATMSNLRQIGAALKQYELDNRQYPDFLFQPAAKSDGSGDCATVTNNGVTSLVAAQSGDTACTMQQLAGKINRGVSGVNGTTSLYPEYVRSLEAFHSANNDIADATSDPATAPATRLDTSATGPCPDDNSSTCVGVTTETPLFYKYDSFDANPQINRVGDDYKLDKTKYQVRYSRLWTREYNTPSEYSKAVASGDPNDPTATRIYSNQLFWRNPGNDTFVTMDSHHVTRGKVVVLFLGGNVKVVDPKRVFDKAPGSGGADIDAYKLIPTD